MPKKNRGSFIYKDLRHYTAELGGPFIYKDLRHYTAELGTQPSGPNCFFSTLLPKGIVGHLNIGRVRMTGPTWNEPAAHDKWHQVYIVLSGAGTMVIDNTTHYMKVSQGQKVEYLYVNEHIDE